MVIGVIGLFYVDGDNLTPFTPAGGTDWHIGAAATLALWAFIGLESATVPAEELEAEPRFPGPRRPGDQDRARALPAAARVEGGFERFFLCHCEYCRKDTGSAHAANLFSSTASLKWLSGREKVTEFNLPSTRHTRCFCSTCGSAVPYQQANGALLVIPAGSLDSEVRIRPDAHIFVSSRAGWDEALERLPSFARLPS